MDSTTVFPLISRWLHVIPAIIMVGGTMFLRLALLPALNQNAGSADPQRDDLRQSVRRNWAKWIGISTLFLLVTGFYNAYSKIITYELPPYYHSLLLMKIILAFAVFYLAAVLSGRSKTAVKMRQRELFWTNILCMLMLAIALIAGGMKIASTGAPVKPSDTHDVSAIQR